MTNKSPALLLELVVASGSALTISSSGGTPPAAINWPKLIIVDPSTTDNAIAWTEERGSIGSTFAAARRTGGSRSSPATARPTIIQMATAPSWGAVIAVTSFAG